MPSVSVSGVDVEVGHLTGVYTNMTRSVVALVFRCRPVAGTPHATDESAVAEWRVVDDAVRDMAPAFAVRITDAFVAGATVRSHDGTDLLG